ncbi:UNVERIFIED_CONTAM: lipopolysaccharide-induced tumor necrosis factor-alpha factor [Acetivibrio alkalicellulosi]
MGFKCVHCSSEEYPIIKKKISGSGWVLFIVLILFCIPLCWLPFVIDSCKEEEMYCKGCGIKLG